MKKVCVFGLVAVAALLTYERGFTGPSNQTVGPPPPAPIKSRLEPIQALAAYQPPSSQGSADQATPQGMRTIVWDRARAARKCAIARGQISSSANMAIIDYDMPSSQKRLWIVDIQHRQTLMSEWVAHGSGSGELMARQFSNTEGSLKTSLGVFRVSEIYDGKHGSSMRLDGLERGFNDQARNRAIVMHSAWYVDPNIIDRKGRLGRSQGCPAVRQAVLGKVKKQLANGGMLFAHASQSKWVNSSHYLNCA